MIIVSKAKYIVWRDNQPVRINIGVNDIPEDIYKAPIVQLAIKDGSIVATGRTDNEIEAAIAKAETKTREKQAKQEKARAEKEKTTGKE